MKVPWLDGGRILGSGGGTFFVLLWELDGGSLKFEEFVYGRLVEGLFSFVCRAWYFLTDQKVSKKSPKKSGRFSDFPAQMTGPIHEVNCLFGMNGYVLAR